MFGPKNRVLDVDRYRVNVRDDKCIVKKHESGHDKRAKSRFHDHPPETAVKCKSTILLLLESPHKDEYKKGDPGDPIAPAQGTTGTNIDKFLGCGLNASGMATQIGNNARVIIANPVQFQTSLWTIHKGSLTAGHCWQTLRNAVWKTLWKEYQIRREFCCRLQSYKPNIVRNCCTGGEKGLRGQVQSVLSECLSRFESNALTYEANHPVRWTDSLKFEPVKVTNEGCRDPDAVSRDG